MRIVQFRLAIVVMVMLISAWAGTAQDTIPSYRQYYNLDFRPPEVPHMWKMTEIDGSLNSSGYLSIPQMNQRIVEKRRQLPLPLHFSLWQSVLLPGRPHHSIRVVFNPIPTYVDSISFVIRRLDARERITAADTLTCNRHELKGWNGTDPLFYFQVEDTSAEILQMCFHAEAKDALGENAAAVFLPCRIFVDSLDIGDEPVRQLDSPDLRRLKYTRVNPLTGKGLSRIKVLQNKRLIGLGESLHRHLGLQRLQDEVLKYLVTGRDCHLVLLEYNLESCLSLNRCINDPAYKADTTLWDEQLLRTARTIRQVNRDRREKVQCYGYDYEYMHLPGVRSSSTAIIDFLTGLKEWGADPVLDELAVILSKEDVPSTLRFLEDNHSRLEKVLWPGEIEIIGHILSLSSSKGTHASERYLDRDAVMADSISFLVKRFSPDPSDAVGIMGHWAHLGLGAPYPPASHSPSAGNLLKQEFGDAYTCIAMLVNGGTIKDSCFYADRTERLDNLFYARAAGRTQVNACFDPVNLFQKADGGLYYLDNEAVGDYSIPRLIHGQEYDPNLIIIEQHTRRREEILKAGERLAHERQ